VLKILHAYFDLVAKRAFFIAFPTKNYLIKILVFMIDGIFLVHLQYVYLAEAIRRAGLSKSIATNIKNRVAEIEIEHAAAGLPPTTAEQIARKEGSGAKLKISDNEVIQLLKQRKKLWHIVAHEEGFFDL
jgi:hypothetical protein